MSDFIEGAFVNSANPTQNYAFRRETPVIVHPLAEQKDNTVLIVVVAMTFVLLLSTGIICYVSSKGETQSHVQISSEQVGVQEPNGSITSDESASGNRSSQGSELTQHSNWDVTVTDSRSGISERYHVRYELAPSNDERYTTGDETTRNERAGSSVPHPSDRN